MSKTELVTTKPEIQISEEKPQDLQLEFFTANAKRTLEILELLKEDNGQTLVLPDAEINIETDREGRVEKICIINRYGKNMTDTISKTFCFNGKSALSGKCIETFSNGKTLKLVYAYFDGNYQMTEYGATYYYPKLEKYWVMLKGGNSIAHYCYDYQYKDGSNQPEPCIRIFQIGNDKPVMEVRENPDEKFIKVKCPIESLY